MHKSYYNCIVLLILLLIAVPCSAIELQQTPIQTELQNSILLASNSWEVEGSNDENKSNSISNKSNKENKSVLKAALYSALVPGLGENYVGHKTKAKVFFTIEAVTWISYVAFHTYGDWKKDDMIRYAADKAGAKLDDKDDQFFDWVGFYDSSEEFNSLGRVSDPDRAYLNSPETYWQWSSEAERDVFRSYKNSSRTAYDRAKFMIMAAISNRIISVIDAIRDAKRHNRNEVHIDISDIDSYNYKFSINPLSSNRQFSLTLYTPF